MSARPACLVRIQKTSVWFVCNDIELGVWSGDLGCEEDWCWSEYTIASEANSEPPGHTEIEERHIDDSLADMISGNIFDESFQSIVESHLTARRSRGCYIVSRKARSAVRAGSHRPPLPNLWQICPNHLAIRQR